MLAKTLDAPLKFWDGNSRAPDCTSAMCLTATERSRFLSGGGAPGALPGPTCAHSLETIEVEKHHPLQDEPQSNKPILTLWRT